MAQNFNVFIAKPHFRWYKYDRRIHDNWAYGEHYTEGDAPRKVAGPFQEPAEAADIAEEALKKMGLPGQSYAELRFNGDPEPHTIIFMLERDLFGVWNTESVKWPIFYPEGNPYGAMLEGWPEGFEDEGTPEDENSDGFGDTDEDSKLMDLSNDGTDEEDENADEEEDDDELEEDEEEDEADDSDELDDDEVESEDDDADEETEGENGEVEDDAETEEEETELPRLKLFAKMRGPLGWRKRADLEELSDRNMFSMKVGVLDPDEDISPAKREKNVLVQVDFIESDDDHANATLRMRLPKGVKLEDFKQGGGDWIVVNVPLPHEDA